MQARDVTSRCSLLIWHYFNTLILIVSHLHALLEGISCSVLHYVHLSNYISFLSESVFFFFWGEGGAYKTIKTEERAMEKDSARPISLERMCFLSTPAYLGPWWIQAQDRYGFQSLLGPERPRENLCSSRPHFRPGPGSPKHTPKQASLSLELYSFLSYITPGLGLTWDEMSVSS